MTRPVHSFAALDPSARAMLVRAFVCLLAADVGLRIFGFARTRRLLRRAVGGRRVTSRLETGNITRLVDLAARHHLYPMHCLPRSLALEALLARQGTSVEFVIGVRKERGQLAAHAWLEGPDGPLGEPATGVADFAPLPLRGDRR